MMLTMSANATYRNVPAVTAKIHCRACNVTPMRIPTTRPRTHVNAERKFRKSAHFILTPLLSKIARSPENKGQQSTVKTSLPVHYLWEVSVVPVALYYSKWGGYPCVYQSPRKLSHWWTPAGEIINLLSKNVQLVNIKADMWLSLIILQSGLPYKVSEWVVSIPTVYRIFP